MSPADIISRIQAAWDFLDEGDAKLIDAVYMAVKASDNGSTGGEDEGESPDEGDEGQKSQAEMLATYKQAVRATIKED